ncbi:MAG TPA: polyphenol oxidase family protein [Polyangiaceae bacterium]
MPSLRSKLLDQAGLAHAFPTRDVTDAELAAVVGGVVIQVKQVHGARALLAPDAKGQEADALVARRGGGAVGVRVADCVPVLVADVASGDVAAIHAGWRGVVAGVVRAGVELLGGRELVAAIGPCIGPCCFEVGREVADRLGFVVREQGDRAYVDLRAAVRAQLRALGVADDRIEDVAGCTKHEPARFHSFRRDGANSGRMLAAIAPDRGR